MLFFTSRWHHSDIFRLHIRGLHGTFFSPHYQSFLKELLPVPPTPTVIIITITRLKLLVKMQSYVNEHSQITLSHKFHVWSPPAHIRVNNLFVVSHRISDQMHTSPADIPCVLFIVLYGTDFPTLSLLYCIVTFASSVLKLLRLPRVPCWAVMT